MLLAKAGADVTVLERSDAVGGRSRTIAVPTDSGTFRFDSGATFFLYPRVLSDIFTACGRRLEDEIELIRLDPQYRLVFENGGDLLSTGDPERMAEQIAKFSPEDATQFPRFMADNRRKLAAFRPVLENAFGSLRAYTRPDVVRSLGLLRPHRTVDSDLATYFKDERIRLAFSFQSKYLGMSPFRCPSLFTILSFLEYEHGVYHPRGGCGAVSTAMARVARQLGAKVELNSAVDEVMVENGRAVGVRVAGQERRFDAVVVNSDFAQTMTRLLPDAARRRWTDKRIAGKKFSCSTFMMYLGIEGELPHLSHHTIYLSADYRRNIAEIETGGAPPTDPSFYVQNACVTDPALAPPGHSSLYVLVPVANQMNAPIDWAREAPAFRRKVLDRLHRVGLHDIEDRIRFERVVTPDDWEEDFQVYRGATFNLAHTLGQMLHLRPRNRFEDVDGMYLVGGGTHPGSGLPVIFESARITSRLLAEDLRLDPAWEAPSAMSSDHYEPALAEETL